MWSNGGCVGAFRQRDSLVLLVGGVAAVWLLAGCGNGQSPTEAARLAESRRVEAETPKTPDVVDTLFLGSGPLIPRDGSTECPLQGVWSGYPRGTTVRMRVSSRVPASAQAALAGAVAALPGATQGMLTVIYEVTQEIDPQPVFNEVTVAEAVQPRSAGCRSDAGCVQYRFAGRGLLMGARVVASRDQAAWVYVRDAVGHGALGLCGIDTRLIGGADKSLMSAGPGSLSEPHVSILTPLDLDAIRTVYASGVNPGTGRSTFLAARLVNLQAGQLLRQP